jgi:hypothetical protein
MSKQLFTPKHNVLSRLTLLLFVAGAAGFLGFMDLLHRSPYVRYTKIRREQPVPFSHKHHSNLGIDCRYCHTSVEKSSFANIPPTQTCMNCHNIMWKESDMLEPVRESWASGESLEWTRVHDLPDFVYFNHSAHVNNGIGCSTCHGRVDQMPLMYRDKPLYMKWCLECHRDPSQFVRPEDKIFDMAFDPKSQPQEVRDQLVSEVYQIDTANHRLTNCAICHR